MASHLDDDEARYTWRFDEATRRYQRWTMTVLADGGIDEVRDDPYAFGRACVLDLFPVRQKLRLLLMRSHWLEQRLAGSGPDLPHSSRPTPVADRT